MTTKSRYEVLVQLQEKKQDLMDELINLPDELNRRVGEYHSLQIRIKRAKEDMDVQLKDASKELDLYRESMEERKASIKQMIEDIDALIKSQSSAK